MKDQNEIQLPVSPELPPAVPSAADQFHAKLVAEFQKPRPPESKRAIARLFNFIVPVITTSKWSKCFDAPDPINAIVSNVDLPWFLGRISRCLAEMNADPAGKLTALNQVGWLRDIKVQENGVEFHLFEDFDELIALQLRAILKQKASEQEKFWSGFAKGFGRSLEPRRQDVKALPIYLFFAIKWESLGACNTMRELYRVVTKHLPVEQPPHGVDPVDFEERQFKWFEKLCKRSLGVSFKSRGRPVIPAKYPQRS